MFEHGCGQVVNVGQHWAVGQLERCGEPTGENQPADPDALVTQGNATAARVASCTAVDRIKGNQTFGVTAAHAPIEHWLKALEGQQLEKEASRSQRVVLAVDGPQRPRPACDTSVRVVRDQA